MTSEPKYVRREGATGSRRFVRAGHFICGDAVGSATVLCVTVAEPTPGWRYRDPAAEAPTPARPVPLWRRYWRTILILWLRRLLARLP